MSGFSDAPGNVPERGKLSETGLTRLGHIFEETGGDNLDVALLGTIRGQVKLQVFLEELRRKVPEVISSTIGTEPTIAPEIRERALFESIERVTKQRGDVSLKLYERLLIDGLEHQISDADIEALCATEKTPRGRSPMLMRQIIIEFLLVLRQG